MIEMMRGELEKTVQEQKYYKIRQNYELTSKDEDHDRRENIRQRLIH